MAQVYTQYVDFTRSGSGHAGTINDMLSWSDVVTYLSNLNLYDGVVFECVGTNTSLISSANAFTISSNAYPQPSANLITFQSYLPRIYGIPTIAGVLTAATPIAFITFNNCSYLNFQWKGIVVQSMSMYTNDYSVIQLNNCNHSTVTLSASVVQSVGTKPHSFIHATSNSFAFSNTITCCGMDYFFLTSNDNPSPYRTLVNVEPNQSIIVNAVGNLFEATNSFNAFVVGTNSSLFTYGNAYRFSSPSCAGTLTSYGLDVVTNSSLTYGGLLSGSSADYRIQNTSLYNQFELADVTTYFGAAVEQAEALDGWRRARAYNTYDYCDIGAFEKIGTAQSIQSYVDLGTTSMGSGTWTSPFSLSGMLNDIVRNNPISDNYTYLVKNSNFTSPTTNSLTIPLSGVGSVTLSGLQTNMRGLPVLTLSANLTDQIILNFGPLGLTNDMINSMQFTINQMLIEWMRGEHMILTPLVAPSASIQLQNSILRSESACVDEFILCTNGSGNPQLNLVGVDIIQQHNITTPITYK